ncbi:hypothetical protein L9F63_018542, partial [Diploptera punctata]
KKFIFVDRCNLTHLVFHGCGIVKQKKLKSDFIINVYRINQIIMLVTMTENVQLRLFVFVTIQMAKGLELYNNMQLWENLFTYKNKLQYFMADSYDSRFPPSTSKTER